MGMGVAGQGPWGVDVCWLGWLVGLGSEPMEIAGSCADDHQTQTANPKPAAAAQRSFPLVNASGGRQLGKAGRDETGRGR